MTMLQARFDLYVLRSEKLHEFNQRIYRYMHKLSLYVITDTNVLWQQRGVQ